MTELSFPIGGYRLRTATDDDKSFFIESMKEGILLSVPEEEERHSDLWMNDILSITSITMEGGMMRSELFILENSAEERSGMLWMGISKDQFTCEDTGYLLGIFVNKELRNKGFAKALIGCAEDWCKGHDLLSMTLNVGSHNSSAKAVYHRTGFEPRSAVMRKRLR